MKITNRQLMQIIKEEMARVTEEFGSIAKGNIPDSLIAQLEADGVDLERFRAGMEEFEDHNGRTVVKAIIDGVTWVYLHWSEDDTWENQPAADLNEGMTPDQMPDSWRQILGDCLEEKS